ncbi:MAG: CPBP family intramembrane metalloprotease, partial [Oscillospiraceae bacterium]|nr:CPBP family intramembrane metalloprotease [Oscillospiraceae bacterium]
MAVSVLPLPASENPAIWRLWAEILPLLAIIAFTIA